ncbi:MAG: VWA-like domain-containing protein [Acidimicrobiales bacterium]|nr:VWA-like domain-containing protein [Acidimicrobiales bacterium]
MNSEERLVAARLWAAYNYPYLASALFALSFVPDDKVDGIAGDEHFRIYVDHDETSSWEVDMLGAEMVHQVGHLLRGHAARAREIGLRESELLHWVDATDAEINDDLIEGHPIPDEAATAEGLGLPESLFGEEYFYKGTRRVDNSRDCGSSAHGNPRPWDEPSEGSSGRGIGAEERDLIRRQVASETIAHHRNYGSTPDSWLRWANGLLEPRIDWRTELGATLRRGITEITGAVDYSYQRPSRRWSYASKVILPSLRSRLPEISVVLDTSASMSEELLGQALAEIDGLMSAAGIRFNLLKVFTCDSAVGTPQRVRRSSDLNLIGGGGTDLSQGINAAVQTRPIPDLLLIMTDGWTPWPDSVPNGIRVVAVLINEDPPATPDWLERVEIREVGPTVRAI